MLILVATSLLFLFAIFGLVYACEAAIKTKAKIILFIIAVLLLIAACYLSVKIFTNPLLFC